MLMLLPQAHVDPASHTSYTLMEGNMLCYAVQCCAVLCEEGNWVRDYYAMQLLPRETSAIPPLLSPDMSGQIPSPPFFLPNSHPRSLPKKHPTICHRGVRRAGRFR